MILTVTMNPSLDMAYTIVNLHLDNVNRAGKVTKTAGGKGLNVTRVLNQLDVPVIATGMIGGNIGKFITDQLKYDNIQYDFSQISSETRNSIAILHDEGIQTEILEPGPEITELEEKEFLMKFSSLVQKATILTISGSLPNGLSLDFYQKLIEIAAPKPVLLDTSGDSLRLSLNGPNKPFLIKPNLSEIQQLVKKELLIEDLSSIKDTLQLDVFDGIEWIVVSLGKDGAIAKHKNIFYRITIPKIHVINPVGSGDSTIAGLSAGFSKELADEDVLKFGMVAGMLNAQEEKTGYINKSNFNELYREIVVSEF